MGELLLNTICFLKKTEKEVIINVQKVNNITHTQLPRVATTFRENFIFFNFTSIEV